MRRIEAGRKVLGILLAATSLFLLGAIYGASAVEVRPKAIIYMSATPGCYSATFISTATISTSPPKKVYQVDCSTPHHFEVFWSGKFDTNPGNPIPNSRKSVDFCLKESKKLKYYSRNSNSYNYEADEEIGIGNWLADKGPEAARFPQRLVCYASLARASISVFKQTNKPLIRGLK